jgi:RNA polymerase sigma-70 factor (ECF subfamily)
VEARFQTIERLHHRYAGVLYDKCARMLGDRQEAEDAVQETFVAAFRSLDRFTYGESHLPWLYRIATNVCLKFLRTRRRKGALPVEDAGLVAPATRNGSGAVHARMLLERLVDDLDEREQEILVAHFIDGMDQGQAAKSLGISRRAVVKRLARLRERFAGLREEHADG